MKRMITTVMVMLIFSSSMSLAENAGLHHGGNPASVFDLPETGTPPQNSSPVYQWRNWHDETLDMVSSEELERFCGTADSNGKMVRSIQPNASPVWFLSKKPKSKDFLNLGTIRGKGDPGDEVLGVILSTVCEAKRQSGGIIAYVHRKDHAGIKAKSFMIGGGAVQASVGGITDPALQASTLGISGGIGVASGEVIDVSDVRVTLYHNPTVEQKLLASLGTSPGQVQILGEIDFINGRSDQYDDQDVDTIARKIMGIDLNKVNIYVAGGAGSFSVPRAEVATRALGYRLINLGVSPKVICDNLSAIIEKFGINKNVAIVYASATIPTKPR